ncbi:hypothetical protein LLEC1_07311 [Akanthomyces lecanii]|uniref:Uncharacterized protein n=1 Tax=Cordyceps confragosa TaxID=2714763 RepID=A0A179I2A0_CORDF|nr:hypothetical protein LLEC1_07311 [Akanthomyces lecanii]
MNAPTAARQLLRSSVPRLTPRIGLIAVAVYAYLTQPKETEQLAGKAIHAGQKAKEAGKAELQNTKEEIVGGVQKLGGRNPDGQKGFRSE